MTPSRTEVCVPLVRPSSLTRVREPQQGISIDSISPPAVYHTSNSWSALGCEGTVSIPSSWACAGAAANRRAMRRGSAKPGRQRFFSMGQASFADRLQTYEKSLVRRNSEPVNSSPEALLRDSRQKRARGIRQANRIHDARKRHSATNPDTRRAQKEGSRKKNPAGRNGLRGRKAYKLSCLRCSANRSMRCSSCGIRIFCGQCGTHWLQPIQWLAWRSLGTLRS